MRGVNAVPSPRGDFWGFIPHKQSSNPPNWNMKHYKLVEFLSIFRVSRPPHKPKAPPEKRKAPYWKLSGDCSELKSFQNKWRLSDTRWKTLWLLGPPSLHQKLALQQLVRGFIQLFFAVVV